VLTPAVPEWLTLPDVADRIGMPVTRVRDLVRDGKLIALRAEPDAPLQVPAALVGPAGPLKHLPAVITLLRDAGYADEEIVGWLFAEDPTLPGTPAAALAADRGTEVKRRAQAMGF
jgi:hypothetical protein